MDLISCNIWQCPTNKNFQTCGQCLTIYGRIFHKLQTSTGKTAAQKTLPGHPDWKWHKWWGDRVAPEPFADASFQHVGYPAWSLLITTGFAILKLLLIKIPDYDVNWEFEISYHKLSKVTLIGKAINANMSRVCCTNEIGKFYKPCVKRWHWPLRALETDCKEK